MAKHLPPSASALRLLDVDGMAGAVLTETRADLRVFLFQLLSVLGQWERALNQLNVAADLDAKTLAMAQMYREAIKCEALRADVFAGKTSPVIFGEPEEWLALLIESLLVQGKSRAAEAQSLRERAFEAAPTSDAIHEACAEAYRTWREVIGLALRGGGASEARAERLATLVLAAVEGAMLLCKAERSARPLHLVGQELEALLKAAR